jgi:hypothetical protein
LGGKYEAWIAISGIFAAIDRFFPDFSENGKPLRKIGKPLKKSESRFRNRKAVEEIGKPLKKIFSDFSEMRSISQK